MFPSHMRTFTIPCLFVMVSILSPVHKSLIIVITFFILLIFFSQFYFFYHIYHLILLSSYLTKMSIEFGCKPNIVVSILNYFLVLCGLILYGNDMMPLQVSHCNNGKNRFLHPLTLFTWLCKKKD